MRMMLPAAEGLRDPTSTIRLRAPPTPLPVMKNRNFHWPLAVLLLMIALGANAAGDARPYNQGYDPARDPAADLQLAIADATAENKKILLKLGGDWCSWCLILDRFVANNDEVRQAYEQTFVTVKVNVSEDNMNEAFLASYPEAGGYPFLIILAASGKFIDTQDTGVLEDGRGYSAERFMAFVDRYRD